MTEERAMDVAHLAEMAREFSREYQETHLVDMSWANIKEYPQVQFNHRGILEIAPLDHFEWCVVEYDSGASAHRASAMIDGVEFFTLCTDEEKAEVMGDE